MSSKKPRSSRGSGRNPSPASRSAQRTQQRQDKEPDAAPFVESSRKTSSRILIEQIPDPRAADMAAGKDLNDPDTGQGTSGLDTLTVPDVDVDESSEASSLLSQHSDDDPTRTTTEDDSIAVDCHTNPSEVIVKGKNVKQIRVKFPPHPPASDDGPRKKSARSRLHRSSSATSVKESNSSSTDEKLPYPFEETSLPAITESSDESQATKPFPFASRQDSCISLHSHDTFLTLNPLNHNGGSVPSSSRHNIDWDLKYKQDILAGLDYFEKRATDYVELSNQLQRELDKIRLKNRELEMLVDRLQKEKSIYIDEVDEVKIKMDQSEKENLILRDQAVSQWQDRVAMEERFVELQRDSEKELKALKEKLCEKDKELQMAKTLKNIDNKSQTSLSPSPNGDKLDNSRHNAKKSGIADDKLELLHNISRLQETIDRLNREKDSGLETNNRLRQEMKDTKDELKNKSQELDSQYKRFLSLKKSFNDLTEEHDKLKSQLRTRNLTQHTNHVINRDQAIANTTWPAASSSNPAPTAQRKNSISTVDLENVSYIDLNKSAPRAPNGAGAVFKHPAATGHSRSTSKPSKSTHKRNKSEVINLADNLPPVPNPSR